MILASSPKAERRSGQQSREPSQQRRAPRGDPGRGEIPMRPKARPVDVFPKINNLLFGGIENKYERKND